MLEWYRGVPLRTCEFDSVISTTTKSPGLIDCFDDIESGHSASLVKALEISILAGIITFVLASFRPKYASDERLLS